MSRNSTGFSWGWDNIGGVIVAGQVSLTPANVAAQAKIMTDSGNNIISHYRQLANLFAEMGSSSLNSPAGKALVAKSAEINGQANQIARVSQEKAQSVANFGRSSEDNDNAQRSAAASIPV